MPLHLVGAGLPRTGTLSLKAALDRLRFAPCHHMHEVFAQPHLAPLWERAFDETLGKKSPDLPRHGRCAGSLLLQCARRRYPDAKLILTVRDEDKWYA